MTCCPICGRRLIKTLVKDLLECRIHGINPDKKEKRDRIGKYSGRSKRYKGAYEKD